MISSTPKKHQESPKLKFKHSSRYAPSELTVRSIMSYAAALRVYKSKIIGDINVLIN